MNVSILFARLSLHDGGSSQFAEEKMKGMMMLTKSFEEVTECNDHGRMNRINTVTIHCS
jgi:hypothetical protein